MKIVTWFERTALSQLIPDPCMVIGGTHLVNEFMAHVEEAAQEGELVVAVPYINPTLVRELSSWKGIVHARLHCTVVTGQCPTSAEACRELARLPWQSIAIFRSMILHAKTYTFIGNRGFSAALIGSHNLTFAGTSRNSEAGVFLISRRTSELTETIQHCLDHIKTTGRAGTSLFDSLTWPEGNLFWRKTA